VSASLFVQAVVVVVVVLQLCAVCEGR